MTESVMKYLNERMSAVVPYAFGQWEGKPAGKDSCYWVLSDYTEEETPTRTENGMQVTNVIFRGFTRGSFHLLEKDKAKIEKDVPSTTILEDGTGVAILYSYGMIVPTGDADLKSMKINMEIQEWRTNR